MDDKIEKKFAELQKYLPFVEAIIEKLQHVKDKDNRELQKMQSLHRILSNKQIKLTIEALQQYEDVLQKLHNKIKENALGLQLPTKPMMAPHRNRRLRRRMQNQISTRKRQDNHKMRKRI